VNETAQTFGGMPDPTADSSPAPPVRGLDFVMLLVDHLFGILRGAQQRDPSGAPSSRSSPGRHYRSPAEIFRAALPRATKLAFDGKPWGTAEIVVRPKGIVREVEVLEPTEERFTPKSGAALDVLDLPHIPRRNVDLDLIATESPGASLSAVDTFTRRAVRARTTFRAGISRRPGAGPPAPPPSRTAAPGRD
jgi:hypothetical protein